MLPEEIAESWEIVEYMDLQACRILLIERPVSNKKYVILQRCGKYAIYTGTIAYSHYLTHCRWEKYHKINK